MEKSQSLSYFLRLCLNWRYSEFLQKIDDGDHTSNERAIFELIKAIFKGKLSAMKEALDRIDGKVEQPLDIEFPKFFTLYPNAKEVLPGGTDEDILPAVIKPRDPIDIELDAHPGARRYAILDDSSDFLWGQHLFRTTWAEGLTDEIADQVIAHLNG